VPGDEVEERERLHRLLRALEEGVRLYNSGLFFECHEVLEEAWLQEEGDDKAFLQGIIKVAAAFHHFKQGTYKGMLDLLIAGRDTLERFRPQRHGIELEEFLRAIESWIPRARSLLEGRGMEGTAEIPPLKYSAEGSS
jgi:predicted metal-dependent hydrolase